MERARSGSRSVSGYAADIPASRTRCGLSWRRPATATTGMPAFAAARATPTGALPASDCASSDPSPVTTRSAPAILRSKSINSKISSIPGLIAASSRANAANPVPPAAPAPARAASSRPVASATY